MRIRKITITESPLDGKWTIITHDNETGDLTGGKTILAEIAAALERAAVRERQGLNPLQAIHDRLSLTPWQ